jgi:mono/diheme cytochrome c family protein
MRQKPGVAIMNKNRIKAFAAAVFVIPIFAVLMFSSKPLGRVAEAGQTDAAAIYKANCAMCHGAKSEKHFDPAKTVDEHVQVILKGKKGEKPPFMPGYEAKGMTAEEAKALAEYMVGLRASAQ